MNAELIAHGFANGLSGMFGGLQTYMTYSNSVLYAKSGGKGKISSLAIVVCTMILFVIGPSIASYLPRCMAGTLLLHIGIDLVLEGVYDCTCRIFHSFFVPPSVGVYSLFVFVGFYFLSYPAFGNYDHLEYAGIWAITLVMTIWGMTAALIAGVIAALTTYAVQSINYQNPIRQILTASTLRSSAWTRCVKSRQILESDATGRARILVFQLQGHVSSS
jgi:SulP family sulfate permease